MNLFNQAQKATKSFVTNIRKDPLITELKGQFHRLSHANGLMELSFQLSEAQRDAFNEASSKLLATRNASINNASIISRDEIAASKLKALQATDQAHLLYEQAIFALFTQYGQIPSRETLAAQETPLGEPIILKESQALAGVPAT